MEFIIYTNTAWDSPPRSRHQLAYALANQKVKTTFVAANIQGKPGLENIKVDEYLDVIIPSFPISRRIRYRTPLVNEVYQLWLFPALKKRFENKEVYVICCDFGGYMISKYFDNTIYFASDDFINNVRLPMFMRVYTIFTQKKLIKSSKFVLATARKLVSDFKRYNNKSFELPLGSPDFNININSNEILRKKDGKIKVVLLGYIDKVKTPVNLLIKILELGNAELHLIGPIKDDILDYLHPSEKVFPWGTQTGEVLMNTLFEMDVAIAPYYMEDSNTGRTPNKMWQYLAAGKPAVITNLPNVQHWEFPPGTVYKANTGEEFVEMIKKAYVEDSHHLIDQRIDLAKNNSWDKRADLLLDYVKVNIKN
ncbi:MAG: glycosyltransferase [Anditalea sp.]